MNKLTARIVSTIIGIVMLFLAQKMDGFFTDDFRQAASADNLICIFWIILFGIRLGLAACGLVLGIGVWFIKDPFED